MLRDEEVRHFATGDGAIVMAQSHGIGAVQRGSVQSLGRQQSHFDARQGYGKLHVARRGGAGVIVGGNGHAQSAVNHLSGRGKGHVQEKRRARQAGRHDIGALQQTDVVVGHALQVIHREGATPDGHLHPTRRSQFLTVYLTPQAILHTSLQDAARIVRREEPSVTEHVNVVSQFLSRHGG